jgi:hypothetical protein
MVAKKAERQAHEAVIDKLIDWEALTAEEEIVRQEIKEKRAERKVLFAEKEAKMAEIKAIIDKKKNWVDLTDEEITKLKELSINKKEHMWDKSKFMHR